MGKIHTHRQEPCRQRGQGAPAAENSVGFSAEGSVYAPVVLRNHCFRQEAPVS